MRFPLLCVLSAALAMAGGCSRDDGAAAPAASAPAAETAAPEADAGPVSEQVFAAEELEQMVAPIALYPDPLLAQVLMAATYPGDVADAAAWVDAHPDATGDAAVAQVADEPWDPSVQALVAFPAALAVMGQDPAWVQNLGDAVLAQPEDVMDAVQRLRRKAQDNGNLASNEYQTVSTQAAEPAPAGAPAPPEPEVIVIQPSQPEVVYVPSYNPTVVYGAWAYPSYPPMYYPPPARYYAPGSMLVNGMMWGAGFAIGNALWGGMDWHHNDIDIDIHRYNEINVNRRLDVNNNTWTHNSINRDGVPYRDQANRNRNGRQLDGAGDREAFRGNDASRQRDREQARSAMQDRGMAPAASNRDARTQARTAANAPGDRDAARERAAAVTERGGRTAPAGDRGADRSRDLAGERPAQQTHGNDRARERPAQQTHDNDRARDSAREQQRSQQPRDPHAFEGASRPQQSHAAQNRGSSSHQAASRPASSRPAGNQTSRPSRPPPRSGGHRR